MTNIWQERKQNSSILLQRYLETDKKRLMKKYQNNQRENKR